MTISEFAQERNVKQQTVSTFLQRKKSPYDRKKGLTPQQYSILDKKYPLPKPIQVVEDIESIKKLVTVQAELNEAKNVIIQLQKELSDTRALEASNEANLRLLEAQTDILEKTKSENKNLYSEIEDLKKEINSYKKTVFGFYRKNN